MCCYSHLSVCNEFTSKMKTTKKKFYRKLERLKQADMKGCKKKIRNPSNSQNILIIILNTISLVI